jgi:hypothetical protein
MRARIQRAGTAKQSGSVDNKSNGKA